MFYSSSAPGVHPQPTGGPPPPPGGQEHLAPRWLSLWTWLAIGSCTLGAVIPQAAIWPLTFFDPHRRLCGRIFRRAAVLSTRLSSLWHFVRVGGDGLRPGRTVVVSNHVSHMDAFVIAQVPWEMKWLGKAALFALPIFGWGMRMAKDVPVVRGSRGSVAAAMSRCRRLLADGMPIFLFPEGTRATGEAMLPFKEGAFRLAIEAQAQVLPLAVAGTRQALPKHSWRFGRASALVWVGEPIATEGMQPAQAAELGERVRGEVEQMLGRIRPLVAACRPGQPFGPEALAGLASRRAP